MGKGWSKGFTKETHPSVRRISSTMRKRRIDNFSEWRKEMIRTGKIKIDFPPLEKDGDLAELLGVVLGDGHIEAFPRTERLLIFSNANNKGFVKRYSALVERLFEKKPYVYLQAKENCIRISLYQKYLSKRLGIPTGSRKNLKASVPTWVLANKEYIVRYLRGLYEAEGSESHHEPTCTHKFNFSNFNPHLLKIVHEQMSALGFHTTLGAVRVQISRREEVKRAVELLQFRRY